MRSRWGGPVPDARSHEISSTNRAISTLRWAPIAIVVVALLIHLPTFDQPLLEHQAFRQTQTAYTARIFHKFGIDLLQPSLPVFGPPWQVPFEFPLFQALAAVVMDAGVAEDTALRLTGFATFLVAAGLLWLLVRRMAGWVAASVALAIFALSPLAIEWSHAAMIEYLALATSLGFALAGLRWRTRPGAIWFGIALALGICRRTGQDHHPAFWIVPFAILARERDDAIETRRTRGLAWVLSVAPILVGLAWTRHVDLVKEAAAATSWLTSGALAALNSATSSSGSMSSTGFG